MTISFFDSAKVLDGLKQKSDPTTDDLNQVLSIIGDDADLAMWFYGDNKPAPALSPSWIPLLRDTGQFEELGGLAAKATVLWRFKASYLAKSVVHQAEEVCQIITETQPFDPWVQREFLEALLKLPAEQASRASWLIWDYLGRREHGIWSLGGFPAAEFMVKALDFDLNLALGVARYLLEIWDNEEEGKSGLRDVACRFESVWEYKELMFKGFQKVWKRHPFRAAKLLIHTLENYVEQASGKRKYDVSTHFRVFAENLDSIESVDHYLEAVLITGICEAGKATIRHEPAQIPALLTLLRDSERQIFKRIEMYLLRFVPNGTETARIEGIVSDTSLFDSYEFKNEYAFLLGEKADDISPATKEAVLESVKQTGIDDLDRFAEWFRRAYEREHTKDDLERYEDRTRAEKLYLVREVFPGEYEEYKEKAGASDEGLEPRPLVGPARFVSRTEGSPASVEELAGKTPSDIFSYLADSSQWQVDKRRERFFEPREALASAFQRVVQQRIEDYVAKEREPEVVGLEAEFADSYFHGVSDSIRGGSWKKEQWDLLLPIAKAVVDQHKNEPAYKDAFRAMLFALHDAFGDDDRSMAFSGQSIDVFWSILEALVRYDEPPVENEQERDPIQLRCSSINGSALEQVVCLAIVCRRDFQELFESKFKKPIEDLLEYVIASVRRPEVNCTFGIDFARLAWLDEKWLREHTDTIFADDLWDAVWGTYVSWGRPSPQAFALLYEKGKYRQAVDRIGEDSKWEFSKKTEDGLADHLMIGLFNGWLDQDPDGLLDAFVEKASASLRGHAAHFLTSGFASLKEQPDPAASERLTDYWKRRLTAMEKDSQANKEEAVQFLYWAKDSPVEAKETLQLLERTLEIAGGEMGQRHFPTAFFEGIRDMIQGNELVALRCLYKVTGDERMGSHFSLCEEYVDAVFEHVISLADEYPGVESIRRAGMELADRLGRLRVYKYRQAYEELSARVAGPEE